MTLQGKHVLVTGGTGFIGSRLALRLASEHGARVTATGRNLEAVSHLQQAGVTLRRADLLDFSTMREFSRSHDVIFHVGAWLGARHGDAENAWALNVFATDQFVRIAAAANVARIVVVSSIAAYGPPNETIMDESYPLNTRQSSVYGRTKAEGELVAMSTAAELGVRLVVARPGIVYGPGSYGWSLRMVRILERGLPVIFGDGAGHAHPVFIDNLIDGLILAATRQEAIGKHFNFVDGPVPWREWFGYYARMCGRSPRRLPLWMACLALAAAERLPLGLSVDRNLIGHYTNTSIYPIQRARDLLAYEPKVNLEEGMRRTESWLRRENYL